MTVKDYLMQKSRQEPLTEKEEELYRELCRREKPKGE